jgi:hypothetical protein
VVSAGAPGTALDGDSRRRLDAGADLDDRLPGRDVATDSATEQA